MLASVFEMSARNTCALLLKFPEPVVVFRRFAGLCQSLIEQADIRLSLEGIDHIADQTAFCWATSEAALSKLALRLAQETADAGKNLLVSHHRLKDDIEISMRPRRIWLEYRLTTPTTEGY